MSYVTIIWSFLKKINWKAVGLVSLIGLCVYLLFLVSQLKTEKKEADDNLNNVIQTNDSLKNDIYVLNKDQFAKMFSFQDSVIKANKMRINRVVEVHTVQVKTTVKDTFYMPLERVLFAGDSIYRFNIDTACFQFSGDYFPKCKKMRVYLMGYNDTLTTIYYKQREKVKWLLGLRIGKLSIRKKSISMCMGGIKEQVIKIEK